MHIIYNFKQWSYALIVSGLLNPVILYFLFKNEITQYDLYAPLFILTVLCSLGISLSGLVASIIAKSLRKKSESALYAILLISIYALISGLALVVLSYKNPVAYTLVITGVFLLRQWSAIKGKIKTQKLLSSE